jgi:hypothetical protein
MQDLNLHPSSQLEDGFFIILCHLTSDPYKDFNLEVYKDFGDLLEGFVHCLYEIPDFLPRVGGGHDTIPRSGSQILLS